jgi:nucleoside-diphosphate-sugar epimerase
MITGHAGYIGSVLVPVLQAAGHGVVGMDTGLYSGCDLGEPPEPIPCIVRDIRDIDDADFAGIDSVVHLAGLCNDPLGDLDAGITFDVNWHATTRLAEAARRAGVRRFIFSSTCSVYGWADPRNLVDEESECRPLTAYAASKLRAESEVLKLATADFSPTVLRSGSLYGYSPRLRTDLVLNGLVASALTSGGIELATDGSPWRPLVAIHDVAGTMRAVLEASRDLVHGRIFNVGADSMNFRVRDIAERVMEAVPGSAISFAAGAGPDERSYRASFRRLAATFPQLQFQTSLNIAITALVEAYRRFGMTGDDLVAGKYIRLTRIRELMAAGKVDSTLRPIRQHARGSSAVAGDREQTAGA